MPEQLELFVESWVVHVRTTEIINWRIPLLAKTKDEALQKARGVIRDMQPELPYDRWWKGGYTDIEAVSAVRKEEAE